MSMIILHKYNHFFVLHIKKSTYLFIGENTTNVSIESELTGKWWMYESIIINLSLTVLLISYRNFEQRFVYVVVTFCQIFVINGF